MNHSLDLRRRVVEAYLTGKCKTYVVTATVFGIGYATVNRWLRRKRDTGDIAPKPKGGNNPRRIDLKWLKEHLEAHPDARLLDRAEAWEKHSGRRIGITAVWTAVHACGWTHKKRRRSRVNKTARK